VAEKKTVLDSELTVMTRNGAAPLFFSAASTGRLVTVVGTKEPFEAGHPAPDLAPKAARYKRAVQRAFRRLDAAKNAVARLGGDARKRTTYGRLTSASAAPLLGILAHDLKNPISGILSASEFLLEDMAQLLDPQQMAMLRSIETSSELALAFIDDILELHSMESGALSLRLRPTEVTALVAQCVAAHQQRAASRGIALETGATGPAVVASVDRRRFAQSINAVIRDQMERLEPGGRIDVSVAQRKRDVAIVVCAPGARAARNGVKAFLERIRHAPSKRRLGEIRSALTLAAVKRIVEAHHGSVRTEEPAAGGTACTIRVPAAKAAG
jgi:signal transduction histidine kinase